VSDIVSFLRAKENQW